MQMALEQLGFGPCYHMRTAMNQYPRDCAMWLEAFRAKYDGVGRFEKQQWDQLLGNYSVSCNPYFPFICKVPRNVHLNIMGDNSLYATYQLSPLDLSSWPPIPTPKSFSQTEMSTHGTHRAHRLFCKQDGTGFTTYCKILTG